MTKPAKAEKPQSELTEQERIDDWRRKRLQRGSLEKPKGNKKKEEK